MATKVTCPTCSNQVLWAPESKYRPFCSKRCQLIDLGEWASESNKIAQNPVISDLTEADIERIEGLIAQQENEFFKQ